MSTFFVELAAESPSELLGPTAVPLDQWSQTGSRPRDFTTADAAPAASASAANTATASAIWRMMLTGLEGGNPAIRSDGGPHEGGAPPPRKLSRAYPLPISEESHPAFGSVGRAELLDGGRSEMAAAGDRQGGGADSAPRKTQLSTQPSQTRQLEAIAEEASGAAGYALSK